MATTDISWAVVEKTNTLLAGHEAMSGVVVADGFPGDTELRPEMIWPDDIAGDVSIPVMTPGRKIRDDKFTLRYLGRVVDRRNTASTQQRLGEMIGAFDDVLADNPDLDDMGGVISAEVTSRRRQAAQTPDGPIGFFEVVLSIHTRLT